MVSCFNENYIFDAVSINELAPSRFLHAYFTVQFINYLDYLIKSLFDFAWQGKI